MKNALLVFSCLSLLFGCKNESSKSSPVGNSVETKAKQFSGKVIDFECESFFKKGDYSSLCFTDSKFPEYLGRGCIFDFMVKGDKQEQSLQIQFVAKSSDMLAKAHFNLNMNNYKKGTVTKVNNLGDAAFFDVHGTDLKSLSRSNKDLHVSYNNITFTIMAEYMTKTEQPCFYNDEDLIAFANELIKNLNEQ